MTAATETASELALEHVVIRVDDLDAAIRDYQSLGFKVVHGGAHSSGFTHNALIHFQDGTFLELIAYIKPVTLNALLLLGIPNLVLKNTDNHIKYRFAEAIRAPEGFIHSALFSRDIDLDTEQANRRGLKTTKAMPFHRLKPNDDMVRWNIMSPFSDDLPFVRDAYVPEQQVSQDDTRHENGVLGISGVSYLVKDLAASINHYQQLLGRDASTSNQDGAHRAEFELDGVKLILLPVEEFLDPDSVVDKRREAPVQVMLRTDNSTSLGQLPPEKTHGARILLRHE